ncbi:MAG: RNA-binding transcriptional accessory protein [Opitutales bacterium]|nr:RNA-binding transcriptional accessory protein [Opitutales bacterium]
MNSSYFSKIATEISTNERNVLAVTKLLEEGATVPFIARYRKEATGGLDEVQITSIRDRLEQMKALDDRRSAILKSLEERKLLTDELRKLVDDAENMARLEDVYLPYKPKRRTKATIAREKGLEPLAEKILQGQEEEWNVFEEAEKYVSDEKEVGNAEEALAGARDIVAEWVNDHADLRSDLRKLYLEDSHLASRVIKGKEEEGKKYRDYFDASEPSSKAPSHRVLAIRRGESEGILTMGIEVDPDKAVSIVKRHFVRASTSAGDQVRQACEDAYKRLLSISMETSARVEMKKAADEEATRVFSENLKELLLAPALGEKPVIAIDPGFRTGCKLVTLDAQGKLLFDTVIYPTMGEGQQEEATKIVKALVERFKASAVAIGNGTASRETEKFIKSIGLPKDVFVIMVNESGASIYSASEVAREEFPDKDLTVRGAVSIGRRLMDPLAELVKIDPKSIGVGQYQHDVDQKNLKTSLEDIVLSCVNSVGVEINTASKQLLSYVSGLNSRLAGEIVKYREKVGPFRSRKELLRVPGLGPKAYEQAAGFLRIRGADYPLDGSAVHPERYSLVEKMASDHGVSITDLIQNETERKKVSIEKYVDDSVGLPTLKDIMDELAKPGRDPREKFEVVRFKDGVHTIQDLKEGQKMPGVVTNVTAFGAFVDVGVHQDGLVHISQLADQFVSNPADIVKVGQKIQVTVTEVDIARNRIGLSMRSQPSKSGGAASHPKNKQSRQAKGKKQGQRIQRNAPSGRGSSDFGDLGAALEKLGL